MSIIISLISQKGGVGKSTLARALAVEASKSLKTLLVDCDIQQTTAKLWNERRNNNNLQPTIQLLVSDNLPTIQEFSKKYDIVIIDGPAHTSNLTIRIAKISDLVIQPSGATLDDLHTSIVEFNTLVHNGIYKSKLFLILNKIHTVKQEVKARAYLSQTDYQIFQASLPNQVSYCLAQDEGKAITEINYPSLKDKSIKIIEEIIKHLERHE